ncbi:hypothetical protein Phum_PHUM496400 [Pediculus humanus corporis]|uniref:Uncharacterized protein n=1 Tax=Pediculus humanus subsp. corporis TaxID=121224 RepID=E0VX76_PEDHC|nr:uncharacterized protein Phum_PHUM496400 [Pediculus humanus corporis]EEB17982.1 hypothetical protein Phum_PHUM496400 [Pediculus humanus corporis]
METFKKTYYLGGPPKSSHDEKAEEKRKQYKVKEMKTQTTTATTATATATSLQEKKLMQAKQLLAHLKCVSKMRKITSSDVQNFECLKSRKTGREKRESKGFDKKFNSFQQYVTTL